MRFGRYVDIIVGCWMSRLAVTYVTPTLLFVPQAQALHQDYPQDERGSWGRSGQERREVAGVWFEDAGVIKFIPDHI